MRLDRNINKDGAGKYALILLRNIPSADDARQHVGRALETLQFYGMLDWGMADSPSEFFLMRLKDRFAGDGLRAYADAAQKVAQQETDEAKSQDLYQWAIEVLKLAGRAGKMSPHCKIPD